MPDSRFTRLVDWCRNLLAQIELTVLGWLFPARETPIDRAIREEGERLRRAFPEIDFDHPAARTISPQDCA